MFFEEERENYIKKIENDYDFLDTIVKDEKSNERYKMIVLDPKSDVELEFAEETYKYVNIDYKIRKGKDVGIPADDIDFEQYDFVVLLKKLMIALINRDIASLKKLEREISSNTITEDVGRLSFQSFYLVEYYYYELADFLAEELGFDLVYANADSLEVNKFGIYLTNAMDIFNKATDYLRLLENYPLNNDHGEIRIVKDFFAGFNKEYDKTTEKVMAYYNNGDEIMHI